MIQFLSAFMLVNCHFGFHVYYRDLVFTQKISWFKCSIKVVISHSGTRTGREQCGLPENWNRVESWLKSDGFIYFESDHKTASFVSKWPSLPVLKDYSVRPDESFWKSFPYKPLPTMPETDIDVDLLESSVEDVKAKMTIHQYERCRKAVSYLRTGAPSFQSDVLPSCFVKNAACAVKHGRQVTEHIASWVKEGFAAGPFDSPPCAKFRVNPIIAVVQPTKVRPVLNVSVPELASFNSCVNEFETEKVRMATASQFGQNLLECGVNSTISKMDLVSAYKQVPAKVQDLRLQGFYWLGKYFVETRQIFGAKTSVCNYDIVGETLKLLALLHCTIPHH